MLVRERWEILSLRPSPAQTAGGPGSVHAKNSSRLPGLVLGPVEVPYPSNGLAGLDFLVGHGGEQASHVFERFIYPTLNHVVRWP